MRPESLYFLFSPITRIKGIGVQTAKALERLLPGATTRDGRSQPIVRDLVFHLPVDIIDRRATYPLREAPDGVIATFVVTVDEHVPPKQKRYGKQPYKVMCSNDTGEITLVFFNAREDYIKGALPVGSKRVISGRTEHFDYQLQMTHPDIIALLEKLAEVQKPEPVYPLTVGLTSRRIGKIVSDALEKLPELPEWIAQNNTLPLSGGGQGGGYSSEDNPHPNPLPKKEREIMSWKSALIKAHHPQSEEDLLPTTPARARLAYDEMLAHQLHLALIRRNMERQKGEMIKGTGALTEALIAALSFTLTAGQKKVLSEIGEDMASGHRMGRLLQGDVGSGKTIVALIAMLKAAEQGLQSALMVPTELIASQHYEVINKLFANIPSPLEGEGAERSEAGEGLRGYNAVAIDRAKELRKNSTELEKKLWNVLRNRQLEQYKFRRQQPIGPYIVDFACMEEMLVVELDGGQHAEQQDYDKQRTKYLESNGYRILRFWNNEVTENIDGVYEQILQVALTPHPALRATLSLKGRGINAILLTGSVKGVARKEALEKIKSGEAKIIIGTHALFQEAVEFKHLALVVVDEQHRFGVDQRMALIHKGAAPHILHMTATPIPRSLTMTLYGDMDISQLTEKPAGRQPITTRLIPLSRYDDIMGRMKIALGRGEKVYWICPLIEDNPALVAGSGAYHDLTPPFGGADDVAAATSRHTEFKARFGDVVGLVHGRMKKDDRDKEMRKFAEGKTRLLVATTVVEVGVDVKDATIMVIEQAERFGLAQLHQLRGRVGRGEKPSSCVLLYSEVASSKLQVASEDSAALLATRNSQLVTRLSILRDTDDGFKIAEVDLAQRGGGELLGTRQSGLPRFIFTDLGVHQKLMEQARDDAKTLLANDPTLAGPRGLAAQLLLEIFGYEAMGGK